MSETAKCQLCGEPMPAGEEMFNYHGYSGPCPKPPLPKGTMIMSDAEMDRRLREIAALAKKQREGGYTTQSDAMMALSIVETLALLLIEAHAAQGAD